MSMRLMLRTLGVAALVSTSAVAAAHGAGDGKKLTTPVRQQPTAH